jgi:hypothetical protein
MDWTCFLLAIHNAHLELSSRDEAHRNALFILDFFRQTSVTSNQEKQYQEKKLIIHAHPSGWPKKGIP